MKGREIFAMLRPGFRAAMSVNRCLPRTVFKNTWWMVQSLPGFPGVGLRYLWAARLSAGVGDNVWFDAGVYVKHWSGLTFGSNVSIHQMCYLDGEGGITIGDEVAIAHGSSIMSADHTFDDPSVPIRYGPIRRDPVVIESDVWIACGVRVLAGAHITMRTVVAAGAVVRRGKIGGGIYGGVPARRLAAIPPSREATA